MIATTTVNYFSNTWYEAIALKIIFHAIAIYTAAMCIVALYTSGLKLQRLKICKYYFSALHEQLEWNEGLLS